jgi:hypothetical protein
MKARHHSRHRRTPVIAAGHARPSCRVPIAPTRVRRHKGQFHALPYRSCAHADSESDMRCHATSSAFAHASSLAAAPRLGTAGPRQFRPHSANTLLPRAPTRLAPPASALSPCVRPFARRGLRQRQRVHARHRRAVVPRTEARSKANHQVFCYATTYTELLNDTLLGTSKNGDLRRFVRV